MFRILVVATYDSFLKSGINLAKRISHSKIDIAIQYVKKHQLSMRQLEECEADKFHILDFHTLKDSDFSNYDIVIISLGNIASNQLIIRLHLLEKRPLMISCFSGVIFGNAESILFRINADILLVNNEYDRRIAQNIADEYNLNTSIINYGLVNIDTSFHKLPKTGKNLFFIDQVKVPSLKSERRYVLDKLIELARQNPDYCIFLKTRLSKNEITVHNDVFPYTTLLRDKKDIPENFRLFNDPIEIAFTQMSACISFSSSVALEAIYYGIPTYIIKDLGISERFYNPAFLQSGLLTSFDDLQGLSEFSNCINPQWFDMQVRFKEERDKLLNELIKRLFFLNRNIKKTSFSSFPIPQKNLLYRKFRKLLVSPRSFFRDTKFIRNLKNSHTNFNILRIKRKK